MDWFKKEKRICAYSEIDSNVSELINKYNTQILFRPRHLDKSDKFEISVWVYLPVDKAYLITVNKSEENIV